jgi:SAM-dependent methyltransferase
MLDAVKRLLSRSRPEEAAPKETNPWNADRAMSYEGSWLGTKLVQKHIQEKISGNQETGWLAYASERYFDPVLRDPARRCLILGANEGWLERGLRAYGFECQICASDIADKALGRARAASEALGYRNIEYRVADLNTDTFEGPFDCILAEGVLHHIENTERLLEHLHDLLTPEGVLVGVEYEGPFRFQLSELQVGWINAALACVPGELRPFWKGARLVPPDLDYLKKIHYVHPSEEAIRQTDPSEAVAGPALKTLIPRIFRVIERKGFGGTLLSYMGGHFPFELADSDAFVGGFLQLLVQIEDQVIRAGILEDDFVFYVLGKRL